MDIPMIPHGLEVTDWKEDLYSYDIPMYSKLKWIFWFLSLWKNSSIHNWGVVSLG